MASARLRKNRSVCWRVANAKFEVNTGSREGITQQLSCTPSYLDTVAHDDDAAWYDKTPKAIICLWATFKCSHSIIL